MEAAAEAAAGGPGRRELLATVAAQEEQLREYRARLRDLVRAHKGLLAERAALEAGLGALAGSAAAEPGEAAAAEAEAAAAAGGPEARLGAALATLAREKARLEASWQAERREARAERERLEGEAREARARLAAQQRDRAQEQADHADMLRELQRLLQDERARRREAELGLEEARREEPRELRAELERLRGHFQAQLLQEAGKAAQADEHLRMGEQRGAALEARISEMSELLGAYEKARQKDQAAIRKLKDRAVQLDLENKTLAVAASGHAAVGLTLEDGHLDANVLSDKVEKLTKLARVAAEHAPSLVGDVEALCPAEPPKDTESGDCEKATMAYYQQELKQLKEEFERYKVRAQVVLKSKSAKDGNLAKELEESQEQLTELKEKYVSLRLSCEAEAKQHQEQLEAKRREVALLQQLHRQELERCLSEGQEKVLRLEEEMHKQRNRALAVLAEKDQELQQLRVLAVPFGLQAPKAATGPGSGGSSSVHSDSGVGDDALEHLTLPLPAPSEPTFLLYTEQLARKEVEILALKKQKHQLEMEAHQLQEKLLEEGEKHREEVSLLQGHIQKTFRDRSREGANLEYLKNIFYRFLTLTDLLGRQQTLTAILTILHFSPEERQAVLSHVGRSSSWWLSGKR
ncbi:GRIP and coiled-coil domain-containing protein 1 [Pantherophis guttatus]|uniref:GRIP and coiled-coil domain-containing protein 1 n=1 Tax=Pantherophis guttatus TaxID=94885 RepID=A0A6P9D175_PANGU|nr:GRIP and coiled-coil domain-containing protein 1 [Pantherophis guttatus]